MKMAHQDDLGCSCRLTMVGHIFVTLTSLQLQMAQKKGNLVKFAK